MKKKWVTLANNLENSTRKDNIKFEQNCSEKNEEKND